MCDRALTSAGASLRSMAYTVRRPPRQAPSSCSSFRRPSAQGPAISPHSRAQELRAHGTNLGSDRGVLARKRSRSGGTYVAEDVGLSVRQICHMIYLILVGHELLASYGYMREDTGRLSPYDMTTRYDCPSYRLLMQTRI